jgi:hypothetical protein
MGGMRVPIVSGMSKESIERTALRFLQTYDPESLSVLKPVPIADIVEFDMPSPGSGLIVRVGELPAPLEAITDSISNPGQIDLIFSPRTYEMLRDGKFRARFTAAHEAGHVVIHADQMPGSLNSGMYEAFARRSDLPAYCDPEWQANYFAACVLMNRNSMQAIHSQYGHSPEAVSELLQVSIQAASKRLMYLFGLVK